MSEIHVPPLIKNNRMIIPEVWLARDVEYRIDNQKGESISDADYYHEQMKLPTLAELRHAFFGGSDEYRQSVLSNRGKGEWTSTFKQSREPHKGEVIPKRYNPIKIINRPESIFENPKSGLWVAEYCSKNAFDVLEPPKGWVAKYCLETGYPEETVPIKEFAKYTFGDDVSYFQYSSNDLMAVLVYFNLYDYGRFCVEASYKPDDRLLLNENQGYLMSVIGGRTCRRTEK